MLGIEYVFRERDNLPGKGKYNTQLETGRLKQEDKMGRVRDVG